MAGEPHQLDVLQIALMVEALAPVKVEKPSKRSDGKAKPAKFRPLPKSTLAALEAKSHKKTVEAAPAGGDE